MECTTDYFPSQTKKLGMSCVRFIISNFNIYYGADYGYIVRMSLLRLFRELSIVILLGRVDDNKKTPRYRSKEHRQISCAVLGRSLLLSDLGGISSSYADKENEFLV